MARRPGPRGRPELSPRARIIGGWLAALLLVLGVAGAVRLFGDSGNGAAPGAVPSGGVAVAPRPITFGTTLTPERLVPVEARTTRFGRDDTFAYAVEDAEPATQVFVEVRRTDGGAIETVQEPVDAQPVPDGPALIGFTVSAANLLDAWGPGVYLMRIYLDPAADAIAEGSFVLAEADPSP